MGGNSYESDTIGKTPLPKVQDRQAQGRDLRDLQKPQTQTEAGLIESQWRAILGEPLATARRRGETRRELQVLICPARQRQVVDADVG
jgi:hypothetical protein